MTIYLYSDGSSTGRSDREWGYGFVVVENYEIIGQGFGGGPSGTNNVAEIRGAIEGMWWLLDNKIKQKAILVADSQYVLNVATRACNVYKNVELCNTLQMMYPVLCKEARWVKGHSKNPYNELADQLSKNGKALYAPRRKRSPS